MILSTFSSLVLGIWAATTGSTLPSSILHGLSVPLSQGFGLQRRSSCGEQGEYGSFQFPCLRDLGCNREEHLLLQMMVSFSSLVLGIWAATLFFVKFSTTILKLSVPLSQGFGLQQEVGRNITRTGLSFSSLVLGIWAATPSSQTAVTG